MKNHPKAQEPPRDRWVDFVHLGILIAMLAMMVGRTMLTEPPFSTSPLKEAGAFAGVPLGEQIIASSELLRVGSAVLILALAAGWAVASAGSKRKFTLLHPMFGVWLVLLAACLFASASRAADTRQAINTALEQVSLLTAGFVVIQLARRAWQRRLVLVVLAGLATMLGAKGLYQVLVEIPDQVASFQENKAQQLAALRQAPDSPGARMFETRLRENSTKGWFGLANVFGTLMVLLTLAAVGLAADKWDAWRHDRAVRQPAGRGPPEKGKSADIPLPLLAAILSTLAMLAAGATWLLTRSRGAMLAGLLAGLAGVLLMKLGDRAARVRSKLIALTAAVLVAGVGLVVLLGVTRGGLPSKTMQVRWEYWSVAADMLRTGPVPGQQAHSQAHPYLLLGVGPGNFADYYLLNRHPGAEEEVKNPHNVIVQAFTEYGLAGGVVFLAMLAFLLIKLSEPRSSEPMYVQADKPFGPPGEVGTLLAVGAVFVLAIIWRLAVTAYPNPAVAMIDNLLPALALAAGLAIALWIGKPWRESLAQQGRYARLWLACGLAGFALHNLTDFGLFQPGAAMAFWITGGAVLAGVIGRTWTIRQPAATGLALTMLAAALVAGVLVLRPVWEKTRYVHLAAEAIAATHPDRQAASQYMALAVQADPCDAGPASDLADLAIEQARSAPAGEAAEALRQAQQAASLASQRNPRRANYMESYLQVLSYRLDPSLLQAAWTSAPVDLPAERKKVDQWLAQHGENPALLNLAAQYAHQAGDDDAASQLLERALKATGSAWPLLWDHLGDVASHAGNPDLARGYWLEFLDSRYENQGQTTTSPALDQWASLIRSADTLLAPMDVQNPRLHLRLAQLAWYGGQLDAVSQQLDAALSTEAALTPESLLRLTAPERAQLDLLRAKIHAVANPSPASGPAPAAMQETPDHAPAP